MRAYVQCLARSMSGPAPSEIEHWFLDAETRVSVRLLRPSDRDLEIDFVESLSERSRYFRLLTPLRYLPADLLSLLLDVDDVSRAALVATTTVSGRERFIAIARYALTSSPGAAELGITVADTWHHRGIASRLLGLLMTYAQRQGFKRFVGQVLPENHAMLALAKKTGFRVHFNSVTSLFDIEIELQARQPTNATGQ